MADKKTKDEDEDDGDQFTCAACGAVYEDTKEIRRIANRLAKGNKPFKCPDCLAEEAAEREDEEEEEEAEEEEAEEEEAPAPTPAATPKKKK
jgi:predicted RNA-binding Zn-ribbon protein involved in translation (DUF1610 family)